MNFLAIDPGVHACAVAVFRRGLLETAGYVRADERPHARGGGDFVVVERPVIRGNNTPDPQTIVDLAWAGAALAYSYGVPVKEVTPAQWKGQVPKPIHHARILFNSTCTVEEARVIERCVPGWRTHVTSARAKIGTSPGRYPGAKAYGTWDGHNLLDAVCLGIWYNRENAR